MAGGVKAVVEFDTAVGGYINQKRLGTTEVTAYGLYFTYNY